MILLLPCFACALILLVGGIIDEKYESRYCWVENVSLALLEYLWVAGVT